MSPEDIKRMLLTHRIMRKRVEDEMRHQLQFIDREIALLQDACLHQIVQDALTTAAYCLVCGKRFGWWCPASSNHCCEYIDDEECIHCGAPEERRCVL